VRFYLDEDLSPQIAEIPRGLGLDVISAHEAGHRSLTDEDQLVLAALDDRCLVTANRDHFIQLTVDFLAAERAQAGVLIVPSSWPTDRFARIAQALARYSRAHEGASTSYLLDFLI